MSDEDARVAAIQAFKDRLVERGDPDDYELEDPATEEQIRAAEETLSIELPPSYKTFLRLHNGGSVWDTSLYGVSSDDGYDLAVLNVRGRQEGLPEHLIGFAATLTGDVWCFDISAADEGDGEAPVCLIDVQQGQVIPAARDFLEFLDRLPDLEKELSEQRGPQPMTVEEWEDFLVRERAKLRRLASTPAAELRMPDPEEVRAELAGKIPVDPRHLKPKS
ncbi:MAG: SMI1/KNR4 family protein [Planctomycetota bacterium]